MDLGSIKIVSDGTAMGTKVLDADGKLIPGCITRIEWSVDVDSFAEAKITFEGIEIDAIAAGMLDRTASSEIEGLRKELVCTQSALAYALDAIKYHIRSDDDEANGKLETAISHLLG